jgi:putative lipoic acid-binding regulatory protein
VAEPDSLIEFPCDFPLKIMGATREGFAQAVVEIVLRHAPDFDAAKVEMRPSKAGNYLSLTCVVRATSKPQLDALYRELTAHPWVKIVL